MEEPQEPVETILENEFHKRKPTWAGELIREAERYGSPEGIHREKKGKIHTIAMCPYYLTSLIKNLPPMKRLQKINNGRMR